MRASRLAAGALSLLACGALLALPAQAAEAPQDDDPGALVLLGRAAAAAGTVAFSGTKVVTTWREGVVSSTVLSVDQDALGHREVRARDASGHPLGSTDLREQERVGAVSGDVLGLLARSHRLQLEGAGSVAGRPVEVVLASRDGRESARVWVDDATGLPVRQEVYDTGGLLRRLSTFTSLTSTTAAPTSSTSSTTADAAVEGHSAWPDVVPVAYLDEWREQGWLCPEQLAGGLQLLGARQSNTATGPVLQLTYSDGIDDASLFVQQGVLDASGLDGYTTQDWGDAEVHVAQDDSGSVVWQGRDAVLTLVSDVPQEASEQIVASLPAQRDGGVLDSALSAGRAVGGFLTSATATVAGWIA